MKILTVFGTRPEAIKMATVVKALQAYPQIECKICVTAQHRQMLDQVLDLFQIKPDFDLDLMRDAQTLPELSARMLQHLSPIMAQYCPDLIVVHGDTSTTFCAALAAYYHHIPVAHVEAGLRTHQLYSPWPEEANRKLTAVLSALHFAPTEQAKRNLLAENIPDERIFVTGNTVIDALFLVSEQLNQQQNIVDFAEQFPFIHPNRRMILITGHRRENFGHGFLNICQAIAQLAQKYTDVDFVYPVHLNPQVQKPVYEILHSIENIYLIAPQDYLPFVYLMQKSYFILTDSGGIQEEAPALGKPVLLMRDSTERPEAVLAGTVRLVGVNCADIIASASTLLDDAAQYQQMSHAHNPYGDGTASAHIAKIIWAWYLQQKNAE